MLKVILRVSNELGSIATFVVHAEVEVEDDNEQEQREGGIDLDAARLIGSQVPIKEVARTGRC